MTAFEILSVSIAISSLIISIVKLTITFLKYLDDRYEKRDK